MKRFKFLCLPVGLGLLFAGSVTPRMAHGLFHAIEAAHSHPHEDEAGHHGGDHEHTDGGEHHEIASVRLPAMLVPAQAGLTPSPQDFARFQGVLPARAFFSIEDESCAAGSDPPISPPFSPASFPTNRAPPL